MLVYLQDPHNYITYEDGELLRELFEHDRLKLANIRTSQDSVQNLAQLKQIINMGLCLFCKKE